MVDKEFFEEVKKADTPIEILYTLWKYEDLLGYDPYYSDFRKALFDQTELVLKQGGKLK